jgi:glycosyltransferase involved in cell wall biosynthesis
MSYLVSHLANGHEVTLLRLDAPDVAPFWPLPSSVRSIGIDKLGGRGLTRLARVASRPWCIRQQVRAQSPDVVMSFMDTMNVAALASCLRLDVPVVVSERNDPALHRIGRAKEVLRDRAYQLAHAVVVQTERIAHYFEPRLKAKLRIIPNPVPQYPSSARPDQPDADGRLRIIAVGRLEPHKGFDDLIRAFADIAEANPDWDLRILGEGPQRAQLEDVIRSRRMNGRVQMPGVVRDVAEELGAAHLMAFPSRYEGFPNGLAEGLALGLPAIGLRDVSGVEELIVDGKTGFLMGDDQAALAGALSALMQSATTRRQFGEAARDHVRQWAPNRVFLMWEGLLREAARGH